MLGPHGWEPSTPYSRGSAGGSMPRARKSFRIQSAPIQAVAEEGTCRQSQSMVPGFARTFQVQGGRKLDSPGGSAEQRPTRSSFVLGKNARQDRTRVEKGTSGSERVESRGSHSM